MARPDKDSGTEVVEKPKAVTKRPRLYHVVLLNDDYTTMEFVVWLLMEVFRHDEPASKQIMLHVHQRGVGVAGVYPREVAEMKVQKTVQLARSHDFPLECTMEPE